MNKSFLESPQNSVQISNILEHAGFKLVGNCGQITNYEAWSALENSKVKIACDDLLGVWYDHHAKKGGQALDLVKHWWRVGDIAAYRKIELLIAEKDVCKRARIKLPVKIPHYIVEDIKEIGSNNQITGFLNQNGLYDAAQGLCKEVYYHTIDFKGLKKHFFAAASLNSKYGWQIISRNFNGCIGKEAITIVKNDLQHAVVFEDQYRYLTWLKDNRESNYSAVVINSPSFLIEAANAAQSFCHIDFFHSKSATGVLAGSCFKERLPQAIIHQFH